MTSPRERFVAALHRQSTDRPPVAHVAALTTVELQQATNCWMPEVHHDPAKLVKLCGANHDILGFDAVTFNINYFGEPAALGSTMNWGSETAYPTYGLPLWVDPEDAVHPENLLDREPIRTYLAATRMVKRDYGRDVGVIAKVMGPLSMVQALHGVDSVMMDMIQAPELVRGFLDVACDILIECANAELEEGADAIAIGEGGAGGNMLSPKMHRVMLLDVHKRLVSGIDGPTIMHICGDITPRLDSLGEVGLTCFNFDWEIDPVVMKQSAAGAFSLMGNINTADLMLSTPDEIERQVVACLEAGIDIISPGCAISPRCPNSNLLAMTRGVARWHENGLGARELA